MTETITRRFSDSTTTANSGSWASSQFEAIPPTGVTAIGAPFIARERNKSRRSSDPKRRLRGFVIAFHGVQARVGFLDGGSVVEYMLPAKNLRLASITAINQPFEMDEFEESGDDEYSLTYRFRPMAKAESATTDIFETDEDLKELRDAALQHFGKCSDD